MEKEMLEVLKSIDITLKQIYKVMTSSNDKSNENAKDTEEKEILNFLKDLTEALGLDDKVIIRKVEL